MEQITYILFGWLLGLLSPVIVEKINSEYNKKQFFKATCTELQVDSPLIIAPEKMLGFSILGESNEEAIYRGADYKNPAGS